MKERDAKFKEWWRDYRKTANVNDADQMVYDAFSQGFHDGKASGAVSMMDRLGRALVRIERLERLADSIMERPPEDELILTFGGSDKEEKKHGSGKITKDRSRRKRYNLPVR